MEPQGHKKHKVARISPSRDPDALGEGYFRLGLGFWVLGLGFCVSRLFDVLILFGGGAGCPSPSHKAWQSINPYKLHKP